MPIQPGQTAINPTTGQRIVFDGKKWGAIGASGVMSDTRPDQDELVKIRDAAKNAEWVSGQADQFGKLNEKTGTGPMNGFGLPFFAPDLGKSIAKVFSPNTGSMDAITSRVAPNLRPPGSGSSSDKDTKMYRQSFPNIENMGPANGQVIGQLHADATDKRAYADFADQWYAKNGTLLGADKAWSARKAIPPKPVRSSQAATTIKTPSGVATVREIP